MISNKRFEENSAFIFFLKISPILIILASILIEHAPIYFSHFSFIRPQISLIFIFFWSVYFPESLGMFSSLLLGLFSDFIFHSILGLNAFLFLLIFVLLSKYKNYLSNRSFTFVYVIFSFVMVGASVIKLLLMAIEQNAIPSFSQELASFALVLCLYPLIVNYLIKFNLYLIEKNANVDK